MRLEHVKDPKIEEKVETIIRQVHGTIPSLMSLCQEKLRHTQLKDPLNLPSSSVWHSK